MTDNELRVPKRGGGCAFGCFLASVALIAVIGLMGWLILAAIERPTMQVTPKAPIPADVPPKAAAPAPNIDIERPGRTALALTEWATPISQKTGIPVQALIAYGNAEVIARKTRPECHVTWNTLAGLGYAETRHGTYNGNYFNPSAINERGIAEPKIVGPALNGEGFAKVVDTDQGVLDGDTEFDRAVGPMQFIPETWRHMGVDADGDGVANPHSIDDAAASAVRFLCFGGRDLATAEGWTKAIHNYNRSDAYLRKVRDAAANYALNQPA